MNRHMKLLFAMLLISCSPVIQAEGYFTSRMYTPYPPGCVTLPSSQEALYGDNIFKFWSGSLWLEVVQKAPSHDPLENLSEVDVDMYRVGCAEPGRSVIMVEFRLRRETVDLRKSRLVLPSFSGAEESGLIYHIPLELRPAPNSWGQTPAQQSLTKQTFGDYTTGWDDPRRFTWRYVLDTASVWEPHLLADFYNSKLQLQMHRSDGWVEGFVSVPATRDVLARNPALPLNGRLSGTWVEEGAADQGFLLTFANPVPPSGSEVSEPESAAMLVFLSWFTFDSEGQQLWLVGNARFPQGETEVAMSLIQVTQGQFLGPRLDNGFGSVPPASVGEIRLRAVSCNALELEYDLVGLDLGEGTLSLQRPAALETAGYPCRDYDARLASRSAAQEG
jgi:hypothetical protein